MYLLNKPCVQFCLQFPHEIVPPIYQDWHMQMLGNYKWLTFDEQSIIQLQKWQNDIHFCPYQAAKGKWILTCKNDVDKVRINGHTNVILCVLYKY